MWTKASDGSVIDQNGNVIWFSEQRFVEDICLGECCFICGANRDHVRFNNEHVLPEWLLRRYDLFDRTIELPNGNRVRYDRYTVPCCAACNALMGERIEKPISNITGQGAEGTIAFMKSEGNLQFFVWMGLIYLKTHLKDRAHRLHLDARQGEGKIADAYDWQLLHQLHSMVRCFCVSCAIDTQALGSFLVLQTKQTPGFDRFDFGDLYAAQTVMLRLDDLGIITVFSEVHKATSIYGLATIPALAINTSRFGTCGDPLSASRHRRTAKSHPRSLGSCYVNQTAAPHRLRHHHHALDSAHRFMAVTKI